MSTISLAASGGHHPAARAAGVRRAQPGRTEVRRGSSARAAGRPGRPEVPPGTSAPATRLRLTRRGRVVVLLGALVALIVVGVFVGAGSVATRDPGTPVPTSTVVVGDGE